MSEITEQVGAMIREARKAKGLTQKEVSKKLGISEGSYNRYENGKANLSLVTIEKVAKSMGIKIKMSVE